jgi:hypothetical protein
VIDLLKVLQARYRVSIRLNQVIVTIELSDLLAALQKRGYKVGQPPRMPIGLGASIEAAAAGPIAQLGETTVDVDLSRAILGIESSSSKEALTGFKQLLDIIRKDLHVDPEQNTWFVETIAELNVEGTKDAISAIRNAYADDALVRTATKMLGEETGFFGIRIGSKESEPSGPNWFDLRIEPLLRNPGVYYLSLVYRNSDGAKVLRFADGMDPKISQIVSSLEASHGKTMRSKKTILTAKQQA